MIKKTNAWYVYMLQCSDNSLYTGITVDPERRVLEHNQDNKLGARYTRARRPVRLVYQESCASRSAAARREAEIRKLTRRQKLALTESFIATNQEAIS
ncbi:MAG: GIY-YIG nuclease family protein [Thiohalophilus sp.]|uniref:GIY-YIG nuclease family protein n=1 Tax=Thiohalophilus sp. TaxID=3028392 RepID=UPI00286FE297|nr:GIY-YIG nuclease family protein [Thiohalophilus sp.]MDR9436304.1 GIY-YIG nuclease family protein [Thiohalophilus sp.]